MIALFTCVATMKLSAPFLGLILVAFPVTGPNSPDTVINAQPLPTVDELVVPAGLLPSQPDAGEAPRQAVLAAGIEAVRRAGVLKKALAVGDKAVDFELTDAAGYRIKASELWSVGPLVVVFYRGGWSPYCHAHLMEMQKAMRAIHGEGAQLVAISPESAEQGLETQVRDKLTFPVLSDKGNAVARQFGIVYRAAEPEIRPDGAALVRTVASEVGIDELPLAATYVIDTGGVIRYAFLDADYSRRARPQAVIDVLGRLRRSAPAPEPGAQPERSAPIDQTARVR
jgi:peroxiredoxin